MEPDLVLMKAKARLFRMFAFYASLLCINVLVHGQEKAPPTITVNHEYDKLNRLVRSIYSNGLSLGWAYDGNGNRTRQASSTVLFPEGVVWEKKTVNMALLGDGETHVQAVERLSFTTGKTYVAASPEASDFLVTNPTSGAVIKKYVDSIRKGDGPVSLKAVVVELVADKQN